MYPMWEVHQVITEHHNGLLRDTARERLRRQLQEMPSPEREAWIDAALFSERETARRLQETPGQDGRRQAARNRWRWLAALLGHWRPQRPEAAQR
jgi:hypothetical protein